MVGWTVFCVVLLVVLTLLTVAWWKIGDQWADAEHKRFGPKDADREQGAPRVVDLESPRDGDA